MFDGALPVGVEEPGGAGCVGPEDGGCPCTGFDGEEGARRTWNLAAPLPARPHEIRTRHVPRAPVGSVTRHCARRARVARRRSANDPPRPVTRPEQMARRATVARTTNVRVADDRATETRTRAFAAAPDGRQATSAAPASAAHAAAARLRPLYRLPKEPPPRRVRLRMSRAVNDSVRREVRSRGVGASTRIGHCNVSSCAIRSTPLNVSQGLTETRTRGSSSSERPVGTVCATEVPLTEGRRSLVQGKSSGPVSPF